MRIFFSTDIHASDKCFRKFLNTPTFYKANVIIIGGDITGKAIIPIFENDDGNYEAEVMGIWERASNEDEVRLIEERISSIGYYPYRTNKRDWEELSNNKDKLDSLLDELMKDRLRRWIEMAEKKLKNTNVKCFIGPGNDDSYSIDQILNSSDYVINPDGKIVELDDKHEMISLGNANMTPWNCPRDLSEDELLKRIDKLLASVKNVKNAIFNIHTPPYDSGLDIAQKLDKDLKPVIIGDETTVPVGSKAVREAIENYQPLLGLHGHIHESRAFTRIGRTLCINPGSEYLEGVLRGAIIEIDDGKVKRFQFTAG